MARQRRSAPTGQSPGGSGNGVAIGGVCDNNLSNTSGTKRRRFVVVGAFFAILACAVFLIAIFGTGSAFENDNAASVAYNYLETLDALAPLLSKNPAQAEATLKMMVSDVEMRQLGPTVRWRLLDAQGDAAAALRRPVEALHFHEQALKEKQRWGASVGELVISYSLLASDSTNAFQPASVALGYLQKAMSLPGVKGKALAVLTKQESVVHECADDVVLALHSLEEAGRIDPAFLQARSNALKHLQLLKNVLAVAGQGMPPQVQVAMQRQSRLITEALLAKGPWQLPDQLPSNFVNGLQASPWHRLDTSGDVSSRGVSAQWIRQCQSLVSDAREGLLTEYHALQSAGHLQLETECIHRRSGGSWVNFELNGIWEERDADGCATAAPVGCALFRRLRAAGMPLIRASYSAVGPKAWLRPHCGMTNGQLKWHFGLIVPSGACATLRVANETHAWENGKILFFDDSFEHEVRNLCDAERVVFQLVFVHPDIPQSESDGSSSAAGLFATASSGKPASPTTVSAVDKSQAAAASAASSELPSGSGVLSHSSSRMDATHTTAVEEKRASLESVEFTTTTSTSTQASVEGLADSLTRLRLSHRGKRIADWCEDMGAQNMDDVLGYLAEEESRLAAFVRDVGLKPIEENRFRAYVRDFAGAAT
eukprot:TRINITY_DN62068_c0_g1_i1.p1 TRINITY_DN62068_c0_g1~~TRINITY_DN62068_c0_g1_i1.p1  ORF type:complete len:655 (-),score=86.11 TRINITY_DN62068_c0_g1_i1:17-1981(-)